MFTNASARVKRKPLPLGELTEVFCAMKHHIDFAKNVTTLGSRDARHVVTANFGQPQPLATPDVDVGLFGKDCKTGSRKTGKTSVQPNEVWRNSKKKKPGSPSLVGAAVPTMIIRLRHPIIWALVVCAAFLLVLEEIQGMLCVVAATSRSQLPDVMLDDHLSGRRPYRAAGPSGSVLREQSGGSKSFASAASGFDFRPPEIQAAS
ncbi:unnamed protein product, partial [Amoebophrya sp. A120]|eukprot:GSA120T00017979001.1